MNEATIKIVGRLDLEYGNLIDQQIVKQIVEEILYSIILLQRKLCRLLLTIWEIGFCCI